MSDRWRSARRDHLIFIATHFFWPQFFLCFLKPSLTVCRALGVVGHIDLPRNSVMYPCTYKSSWHHTCHVRNSTSPKKLGWNKKQSTTSAPNAPKTCPFLLSWEMEDVFAKQMLKSGIGFHVFFGWKKIPLLRWWNPPKSFLENVVKGSMSVTFFHRFPSWK